MKVQLKFEPRDLWLGVFVDTDRKRLYICLLPCLPVVLFLRPSKDQPMPDHPMSDEERVARAIWDSANRENPEAPTDWTFWTDEARAAIAALGPQLTAEEKDAIPLLLEAAQNYDTRLPAEQGGEAQHSLVAKLSLIAHGEKR